MGLFQFLSRRKPESEPVKVSPPSIAQDKLKAVVYGLAIGDALGVPYEFQQRDTFTCTGLTGHGTHNQPTGTWSDDTAMSLATLDSLSKYDGKVDTTDLMIRYKMRMAPCAFYHLTDTEIEQVSAITHAHEISMTACVQYVRILEGLVNHVPPHKAITDSGFPFDPTIPRTEVESDGFVLHTLNAALWCLSNTDNYQDCVLTAVNLGEDTDTTASVAGALAGAVYGFESIPQEWVGKLRGRELLDMYVSEATRKR